MASGTIKNIIFDLGGVLVDIDPDMTAKAFARLSNTKVVDIMELHKSKSFFVDYEKGMIDDATFRNNIRQFLKKDLNDDIIDNAWTAMLLVFPEPKIRLLKKTREKYRTFLLSNTNNIHRVKFEKTFRNAAHSDFYEYFENVHYSYVMHMRKPDREIFLKVMEINNLVPQETLLIDDNLPNIEINQEIIEL